MFCAAFTKGLALSWPSSSSRNQGTKKGLVHSLARCSKSKQLPTLAYVWLCKSELVAASDSASQVQRTAARELDVLRTLHHPNLVSFLESFQVHGTLHLVFEFMDRTLLQDLETVKDGLPAEDVQSHMLQLVLAVAFLHKNKVGSTMQVAPKFTCIPV